MLLIYLYLKYALLVKVMGYLCLFYLSYTLLLKITAIPFQISIPKIKNLFKEILRRCKRMRARFLRFYHRDWSPKINYLDRLVAGLVFVMGMLLYPIVFFVVVIPSLLRLTFIVLKLGLSILFKRSWCLGKNPTDYFHIAELENFQSSELMRVSWFTTKANVVGWSWSLLDLFINKRDKNYPHLIKGVGRSWLCILLTGMPLWYVVGIFTISKTVYSSLAVYNFYKKSKRWIFINVYKQISLACIKYFTTNLISRYKIFKGKTLLFDLPLRFIPTNT